MVWIFTRIYLFPIADESYEVQPQVATGKIFGNIWSVWRARVSFLLWERTEYILKVDSEWLYKHPEESIFKPLKAYLDIRDKRTRRSPEKEEKKSWRRKRRRRRRWDNKMKNKNRSRRNVVIILISCILRAIAADISLPNPPSAWLGFEPRYLGWKSSTLTTVGLLSALSLNKML